MEYVLHILTMVCIYAGLAMSLNLTVGFAGQPNVGHAAFFCVGAYTSAILTVGCGASPPLGMACAVLLGSVTGALASAPALRLKGDYLALATFGTGVIIHALAKNWVAMTRGPMGIPGIPSVSFGNVTLSYPSAFCAVAVAYAAVTYTLCHLVVSSPFGLALRAIREDETVAKSTGISSSAHKILVFALSGALAGLAGALFAHHITFIDPSTFTPMDSLVLLLITVFGGMGSLAGSCLAALVLIGFPEILRYLGLPVIVVGPLRQMAYGLLLVMLMLWRPQGLLGKYRWSWCT